jgi:hypothetical protein
MRESQIITSRRHSHSLVLLAPLRALPHGSLNDPPRLRNQLMQLLPELLTLGRIMLFPVLLALKCSANGLEDGDDFLTQLRACGVDELLDLFFGHLGDLGEGTIGSDDVFCEVLVADVFELLTWNTC